MPKKKQSTREKAARALCRLANQPEDITFMGKPMWQSYLDEVDAVIKAIGWKPEKPEGNA
jgi:hypothetical protein